MIEILGVSIEGYKIKHFVSTFFLSEIDPKNITRIGFKIIFEDENERETKEKNKKELEMKIYLRLKPESKICRAKDISYKLEKEKYKEGIGAEYKDVIPAEDLKSDIGEFSLKNVNLEKMKLYKHQFIRLNFKVDYSKVTPNERTGEKSKFGILIRIDAENEGIESDSLLKRALGLSKYAWNFHTCLWGEYENAYPYEARRINFSEEIQAMLIIPDKLYTSFGQVNVLPGAYSIHLIKGKDVDSLALEPNKEDVKSEKEEIKKWYKAGSFMINWEFRKTHRVSREVIVEHNESFPRLSMGFIVLSLLFSLSMCIFSEDIYRKLFIEIIGKSSTEFPYFQFKILLIFFVSFIILSFFVYVNFVNYAFHEINIPTEIGSYVFDLILSTIASFLSFIPLVPVISFGLLEWIEKIDGIPLVFISIIIILMCSYILARKRIEEKKPKKKYSLGFLPIIGSFFISIFALSMFSMLTFQNLFLLWAYLCSVSAFTIWKVPIEI